MKDAEKMAMTEAMLDFDSMAKDIVNAKTQDKKIKAMDRLYKRVQSQSKLRDMSIEKVKKQFAEERAKEAKRNKKTGGLIKKSRGGIINGNDLVASYYDKG